MNCLSEGDIVCRESTPVESKRTADTHTPTLQNIGAKASTSLDASSIEAENIAPSSGSRDALGHGCYIALKEFRRFLNEGLAFYDELIESSFLNEVLFQHSAQIFPFVGRERELSYFFTSCEFLIRKFFKYVLHIIFFIIFCFLFL